MREYNIILKREHAEVLKRLLKERGISYEPSSCGESVYISIRATEYQACAINTELERLYS